MSCNITAGISTGCNDQVGGIVGIHYFAWSSDLVVEKDANGVIIRVYRAGTPNVNIPWQFIQADNGMGSVTETYNVGGTGSILGFHQSANFFIPETATPIGSTLIEFIETMASQNNLVIGIETQDNGPLQKASQKCYVFGLERPAYCASGSKESGISYTDNNGYNIELAADSKTPMQEIAYMAMHTYNLSAEPYGPPQLMGSGNTFRLNNLVQYEGGNITGSTPTNLHQIAVQPGELLTVEVQITTDWSAFCFSGTTFLAEFDITLAAPTTMTYTNLANYPLPTAPGVATVQCRGTYENTQSTVRNVSPVRCVAPSGGSPVPTINVAGTAVECKFIIITRTQ